MKKLYLFSLGREINYSNRKYSIENESIQTEIDGHSKEKKKENRIICSVLFLSFQLTHLLTYLLTDLLTYPNQQMPHSLIYVCINFSIIYAYTIIYNAMRHNNI